MLEELIVVKINEENHATLIVNSVEGNKKYNNINMESVAEILMKHPKVNKLIYKKHHANRTYSMEVKI